jgi:hypothetical protein
MTLRVARTTIGGCLALLTLACATVDRGVVDRSPRVDHACPLPPGTEEGDVLVTVRDRFDGPLPGVTVRLLRSDGSVLTSRPTDAEGTVRLSGPRDGGPVVVQAQLPRFLDAEARGVVLRAGCQTVVVLTMITADQGR